MWIYFEERRHWKPVDSKEIRRPWRWVTRETRQEVISKRLWISCSTHGFGKGWCQVKRFRISGNWNHVNSKLIMSKNTPHIELRCNVIYTFRAEIYQADQVIKGYVKMINPPLEMCTSLAEIKEYIEACEQKRWYLDNVELWSKAYMPKEPTTDTAGNYKGKVVFQHIQVKLIASNELLMGCGPLPEWLASKPCIYSVDKLTITFVFGRVWRSLNV